jgi:putative phosphoribosyl transferase
VLAVPVAPSETIPELRAEADDVVCLEDHRDFGAIGYFYRDFHQISDQEVIKLLQAAGSATARSGGAAFGPS